MYAQVDSALTINKNDMPTKLLERLYRALSFPNPAYLKRQRLGLRQGDELETLCFVKEKDGKVRLPRGAIDALRDVASANGFAIRCNDVRVLPHFKIQVSRHLSLRDYQQIAVDKLTKVTQGTVVIPCGGGKTRVGLGAIAHLQTPTLVLTHTLDLAEQWRFELFDKLGIEAGFIGDGEVFKRPVTIAIVQALIRWEQSKLDALLKDFGLLIVDEGHHIAANTFHAIVDRCPARYRLGLTATPEREDGLTPLLDLFLGKRLLSISHQELVDKGVLTLPEVRCIKTEFTYDRYHDAKDYAAMLTSLAFDEHRNRLIVDHVVSEAKAGHVCLILSGRVEHCKWLAKAVTKQGVTAAALTGILKRENRKEILDSARAGKLLVLVATSIADEGLDLPRLSRVFLAQPSRAQGRTIQRIGRLMRPHPDKPNAILFDFVDEKVPLLRRHHVERKKLYADILGVPASKLNTYSPMETFYE